MQPISLEPLMESVALLHTLARDKHTEVADAIYTDFQNKAKLLSRLLDACNEAYKKWYYGPNYPASNHHTFDAEPIVSVLQEFSLKETSFEKEPPDVDLKKIAIELANFCPACRGTRVYHYFDINNQYKVDDCPSCKKVHELLGD